MDVILMVKLHLSQIFYNQVIFLQNGGFDIKIQ